MSNPPPPSSPTTPQSSSIVKKAEHPNQAILTRSFLKLCKSKYYNYAPIYTIQPNFTLQTGDPIGPGSGDSDGGRCIWSLLDPSSSKTFVPNFPPKLRHAERGTVSMATAPSPRDPDTREAGSQFIITLGDKLEYLDGKAAPFGRVVEGFDVLEQINHAFIDESGRPLKDIRIRHTIVLDEAEIPDPLGFVEPPQSPVPTEAQLRTVRIADDEELDPKADQETVEKLRREREARAQALTLEMVGDLPFAEVAPPENVLFVAKLNPVTRDEDLNLIFSRFGKILSCEVIRDKKSGDSLQYAFIEFAEKKEAEQAYFKMQSVLIDDCRIHVDFSQSVSRLADGWRSGQNARRGGNTRGGFGGIEGLEKKRQYRAYGEDRSGRPKGDSYGMMFDGKRDRARDEDGDGFHGRDHAYQPKRRSPSRSRSPRRRRRSRSRDYDRRRRSPNHRDYKQRERTSDRDRDRNHGRHEDRRR